MWNQIIGVLVICVCSFGLIYSWKHYRKDRMQIAIMLLIGCGFVLRLYTSFDFLLHEWDERYHAVVAKNLLKHPLRPTLYDNPVLTYNFKHWGSNHIWLHKQPLPLWGMALSMWIFGVNEIALRLPSMVLSTIGIWLTYTIGIYFFNKKVGYIAAFLFTINGLIIELAAGRIATDHIDIFFLFFIELAVLLSIRFGQTNRIIFNILAGISIGAAILSKWLPALIVLPVWILIVQKENKLNWKNILFQFLLLLSTCILVFLPWQIYINEAFPFEASWEADHRTMHFTEVIEGHSRPFHYYITMLRINYGELIYLPLIWFIWKTIKSMDLKKRLALVIWFLVPLIFFSFAETKMKAYILFTCPALFIITAEFWISLFEYKKYPRLNWLKILVLILLIALPVRYTIERIKPFDRIDRNPEWVKELRQLNNQNIHNGILFNYSRPIEAMFYTDLTAYMQIPSKDEIQYLIRNGYTIVINDDGKLPDQIRTIEGIRTIKFESSP